MSEFFSSKYSKLAPYVPGEQPKERKYIKLNTNESPFAPSPRAVEYGNAALKGVQLYSDPECTAVTNAIADDLGVEFENVLTSNGSDEVLNFAFMAYCDKDNPAIFPDITYGFYKVFAGINNLPYEEIPLKEDFSVSVDDYIGKSGTVFIANPNAPTGLNLPLSEIERLVSSNQKRVVVIDEAYVDFGGESAVNLTKKYKNLIVTRTFSKSRSMAGARLGFCVADKGLIADLKAIKYSLNPYNVNSVTAAMGVGSVEDKDYFNQNCKKIIENRIWAQNQLESLGFTLTNSKANFIFAKTDKISGENLYLKLKDKGILVRHFDKPRIKEYNRITVGSAEEMKAFISAVKSILENK